MKGRIVLLDLFSSVLVLALVMAASAQTRVALVNVGDTWRYSATAHWSSTDPTATPPSYVVEFNDTQWMEINITMISLTNVTAQMTAQHKNGTQESTGGWIDIDTGNNVNMTYMIISGNLSVGDSLYTSSYANWFINETVPKTYLSSARDTNHVNITSSTAVQYLASNLYWDKWTGILVEILVENTYQTLNYTTSWSMELQITSSDLWVVPEFPTLTPILGVFTLLAAVIAIGKKRLTRAHASFNQKHGSS